MVMPIHPITPPRPLPTKSMAVTLSVASQQILTDCKTSLQARLDAITQALADFQTAIDNLTAEQADVQDQMDALNTDVPDTTTADPVIEADNGT